MNYKTVSNTIGIILVFFLVFPILVLAKEPASFIRFDKAKQKISVHLEKVDISDMAQMLSKDTGIKVFLDKEISRTITSSFENEPIESGVKKLLGPDINSAFIFIKENQGPGEVNFRLETVKIFNKGNMLNADFKVFDKDIPEVKENKVKDTDDVSSKYRQLPGTPSAIHHEILAARKNIQLIHEKSLIETNFVKRKIMELKMKLSQNLSPEERAKVMKQLNQAESDIVRIKASNSRLIMDEEQNYRELVEEKNRIENQMKLMERQKEAEKQRKLNNAN